jgi:hypothetical protein
MNHQMLDTSPDRIPRLIAPDEKTIREIVDIVFTVNQDERTEKTERSQGRALALGTHEIDPRVFVQQGSFTIHVDDTDLALMMDVERPSWGMCFRIPKEEKRRIQELLQSLSINKSTLFPDLGALADELKAQQYYYTLNVRFP